LIWGRREMSERITEEELIEIETSAAATLEWEAGEFDIGGGSKACEDLLKLVTEIRVLRFESEKLKDRVVELQREIEALD
jgi:hypothetical protein